MCYLSVLVCFLLLYSSLCVTVTTPQCLTHMSEVFSSEKEKMHWRSVYDELMSVDEKAHEDLYALIGYYMSREVDKSCGNDKKMNDSLYQNNFITYEETGGGPTAGDCDVLSELYEKGGGGKYWGLDESWNYVKTNCCHCPEVNCNDEGRVMSVEIYGLIGELPTTLWNLTKLESLILVGKEEDIGDEMYPRGSIETLFEFVITSWKISPTFLRGEIPEGNEADLPNLETLVVFGSFDEGYIPSRNVFEHTKTLMLVGDWECDISSVILPDGIVRLQLYGSFYGKLPTIPTSVLHVDIEGNFVVDLEESYVENLNPSITVLSLAGDFGGSLPLSISNLTSLNLLQLDGNFLGEIHPSLSQLINLKTLWLIGQFSGHIPTFVSEFRSIKFLGLCGNFQGDIPEFISSLHSLRTLYLSGDFSGNIPSSLSQLSNLTNLQLMGNFDGFVSSSFCELKDLKMLELVGNFDGELPSCITSLSKLTDLKCVGNFNGLLPRVFLLLEQLRTLHMVGNFNGGISMGSFSYKIIAKYLTDVVLVGNFTSKFENSNLLTPNVRSMSLCCGLDFDSRSTFKNLTKLERLDLSGNHLGVLAPSIVELQNLQVLILENSGVYEVPSLVRLRKLRYVSLAHNHISNAGEVFHVPSLEEVDLSHNNLQGRFVDLSRPCHYGWKSLFSVSVSHNNLTEFVLIEPCELPILRYLDISHNQLKGSLSSLIPFIFPTLREANFSHNLLSGDIPASFRTAIHMTVLDIRENKDMKWEDWGSVNESRVARVLGDTTTTYRNIHTNVSWTCKNVNVVTAVGDYLLRANDGYQNYRSCVCDTGFFGNPPKCLQCDEVSPEATCPGNGNIYAPQGYWATPPIDSKNDVFPTALIACSGAGTSETRCRPQSKKYDKTCADGYRGRMCSECDKEYFSVGYRCVKCMKGEAARVFFLIGVSIIFMLFVGICFSRTVTASGSAKVLILYIQTLYYVWCRRSVGTGGYISSLTSYIGQLQLPGPSCYINGWTYQETYALVLVFPFIVLSAVGIVYVVGEIRLRVKVFDLQNWRQRCKTAVVFAIYFSYVGFSTEVVEPIPCEEDPGLKKKYMTNVPDEKCSDSLRIVSISLLFGVVLLIPSILGIVYFRKGRPSKMSPLHAISRPYVRKRWMWEIVMTGRRVLLIMSFVLVPFSTAFQSLLVSATLTTALILQVLFLPFRLKLDNIMEIVSILLIQVNYSVVLQYGSPQTVPMTSVMVILVLIDAGFVVFCVWSIVMGRVSPAFRRFAGRNDTDMSSTLLVPTKEENIS